MKIHHLLTIIILGLGSISLANAAEPANTLKNESSAAHDFSNIRFKFTASKGVNIMIVSCIDFRLRTELEDYATGRFGPDSYDEVALAGAALGVLNDAFPDWHETFIQNLDIAIKLHGVNTVVFIDHRDCGAYKQIIGADCCNDLAKETLVHEKQMEKVRKFMQKSYPNMKLETLLMNLDGTVDVLGKPLEASGANEGTKKAPRAAGNVVKAGTEPSKKATGGAAR